MTINYLCTCKACKKEYSTTLSSRPSERTYCDICLELVQSKNRSNYFDNYNSYILEQLEDYKYALEQIANSDVLFDLDKVKLNIEDVYGMCVNTAIKILKKYN